MPRSISPVTSDGPPYQGNDGHDEAPRITTWPPAMLPASVYALPMPIRLSLAAGDRSALHAWRCYQGLSARKVAEQGQLNPRTLHAIDSGFVALCEWTVTPIAQAMCIGDDQLLMAQRLADEVTGTATQDGLPPAPWTSFRPR